MVAALSALLIGGAACSSNGGGPGVASIGSSGSPSGSSGSDAHASPLAYSQCMRSHGVPNFPDPDANGGLRLQAGPGTGIDPNSPTFKAAQQACESLQPTVSPEEREQAYEALLKFAKCMRAHGISEFPDPDPDGGLRIQARNGGGLDPNSPTFQAAQQACQKYMPGGKGAPGGTTNEGNG
jgi:hypothetical protein